MNNRELKFRVYIPDHEKFSYFRLGEFDYSDRYLYQHQYPVQQYTGLQDRDGKEIYEGDIICGEFYDTEYHHSETIKAEVIFNNGAFNISISEWHKPSLEIIGNIFENPKLLKTNE
jgi:uncharacterized phage protein (TIGR01671 family)